MSLNKRHVQRWTRVGLQPRSLVLAVGGVVGLALLLPRLSLDLRKAIDDIGQLIAAAVAAAACLRARSRSTARSRTGWSAIAAGLGTWIVGQLYWILLEVVRHQTVPSPSPADVAFIAAIPLWALGLLLTCFPSSRGIERVRTALDGMLIASSLLLVANLLVFRGMLDTHRASPLSAGTSLVYPVGDVLLATIVLLALSQAGPSLRRSLLLLVAALGCLAVSDWYFAASTVSGTYHTGAVIDVGWIAGFLFMGAAAAATTGDETATAIETTGQAAAPYLVLLAAMIVTICYFALGKPTSASIRWTGLTIFTIATVGLIVHRLRWRQADVWRAHVALHDDLTGLPNFVGAQQEIDDVLRGRASMGVLYCDIDRLDAVNSSLGRHAGDALLHAVASRMRSGLPSGCTVARCAGDEFVVICKGVSARVLVALADQVLELFATPFQIEGHSHAVSMSVGVATRRPGHDHADQLLRDGQHAMLKAKAEGPGRAATFEPDLDQPWTIQDLTLEDDLRAALRSGEGLVAYFQPIVRVIDGGVVGFEALVRWDHPTRGVLGPGSFVPLAETTGLIAPLGWWMLEQACHTVALTSADAWVSVNVAGAQLGRGDLCPAVARALDASGLAAKRLHLEITESQFVDPTPAVRAELAELDALGVGIALDDFGTGYSSVALLRDLAISAIKIDLSFTRLIDTDPRVAEIVRGLIAFCKHLGIDVVAEGVETTAQAELLRAFECAYGQGYLYGRPSPDLVPQARRS